MARSGLGAGLPQSGKRRQEVQAFSNAKLNKIPLITGGQTDWAQKGTGRVSRSRLAGQRWGAEGKQGHKRVEAEAAECPVPGSWDGAVLDLEPARGLIPKPVQLCKLFIVQF